MLRRFFRLLFFVPAGTICLPAQTTTFHATYDIDAIYAYAGLSNVITTADGGYAFPTMVNGPVFDSVNLHLIKTHGDGTIDWVKRLNNSSRLWYFSANTNAHVLQLSDGGYVVDALVRPPNQTDIPSLVVFRLDGSGNSIWQARFPGDFRLAGPLMQASDGGIIVTGTTFNSADKHDFWMGKLDANGACLWSNRYDFTHDEDYLNAAVYTSDGSIVLTGPTERVNSLNMGLIKTDGNGNVIWQKRYQATGYDFPHDIIQASNGDYVVMGRSTNANIAAMLLDIFVARVDVNGNVLWSYWYGDSSWDEGYSVTEAANGDFVFACESQSFSVNETYEAFLMRTDGAGNFTWMKRFAAAEGAWPAAVTRAPDNGFALTGVQGYLVSSTLDVFLVKTDEDGNTSCATDSVTVARSIMPLVDSACGYRFPSMNPMTETYMFTDPNVPVTHPCQPETTTDSTDTDSLFIPNVFSPNGTAPNDVFFIVYDGNEPYHLWIYDRWGVLMYENEDKNFYWDGRARNGEQATVGTYYYVLEIGLKTYAGFLTLVR